MKRLKKYKIEATVTCHMDSADAILHPNQYYCGPTFSMTSLLPRKSWLLGKALLNARI